MTTVHSEDRDGGVRFLTLDRPPANAIDESLLGDLREALGQARASDSVRALVLAANGKFFSGGFDLSAPRRDGENIAVMTDLYRDTHLQLLEMPKPTVAMVRGHAIAGGLILVLACDYRLGLDGDYKVGVNEVAIGASYPRIALEILKLRLPHARAAELALGAALYPSSQALRLGIVDELLPAETFEDTVLRRARRMGAFPRDAYAHTKAGLIAETVARVNAESQEEALRGAAVWMTSESRAARAAQREMLGKK
jgi:enoyl-CoA hydratase